MKQFFIYVILLFFALASYAVPQSPKVLKAIEKEIARSKIDKKYFGVWVKGLNTFAEINGGKSFVPASLSKIPTALAVLNKYDVGQKFKTWIYADGDIKNGVLHGDLYLKGGGDPTFVNESMWMMIKRLKRDEISKITGKIFVDDTFFDSDYYSNGRQSRRVDRAYDAPVSALSFNWNSISVYVRPGATVGSKARVFVDPPTDYIKIENNAKTVSANKKGKVKVSRVSLAKGEKIIVNGSIGLAHEEKDYYKSITRPALWTGYNFKHFLNEAGIEYKGEVTKKKTPANAIQLVEYESWSMPRVISAMSKFSNNYVAEMLTKHLGKKEGVPANINDGLASIRAYLNTSGWQNGEYKFVNPSGFTRNNKMMPSKLGDLLYQSRHTFKLAPEFLSALPVSGIDGTLKDRMDESMRGKVRAKTGYLSGVVGLAGYMKAPQGPPMTFVLLYNGPYKHDWEVRHLFDRLLGRIYQASKN